MSVTDAMMKQAAAFTARWDRTTANWNTDRNNLFAEIKKDALSRWENAHNWSFLYVQAALELVPSYTTGTVTIVAGVVTLADGTWPSWAAQGDLWVTDDDEMRRYSVDSGPAGATITLDDTSVAVAAGATYALKRHWYDLPSDFGGALDRSFAFRRDSVYAGCPIERVGLADFQLLDRDLGSVTGAPRNFTLQPDGTSWKVGFTPLPGDTMFLDYRYRKTAAQDSSYPYGDQIHTESILASVRYSTAILLGLENAPVLQAEYLHKLAEAKRLDGHMRPIDYGPGNHGAGYDWFYDRHRHSSIDDATLFQN